MEKLVTLTAHALIRLRERGIDPKWIKETVLDPDWPEIPETRLLTAGSASFLSSAAAFFGACVETNVGIRVISVMFDRNARRKP
jgi:Domain of unknown function (DUF4258)